VGSGGAIIPTDLYAVGNRAAPRPPRQTDIDVDKNGMIEPTRPPAGASSFAGLEALQGANLSGDYHILPAGVILPEELAVIADGEDVGGPNLPGHHTIYPSRRILFTRFAELFSQLPWRYGSKLP
jgi:hypothetical protein